MSHPFVDGEHLRYSPREVQELIDQKYSRCSCRSKNLISREIETYPKFRDSENREVSSTALEYTCQDCGRVWETAFELVLSVVVLKERGE